MTLYNSDGQPIPKPHSWPARAGMAAVGFYQKNLSGLKMGASCRFEPTCSAYALEAIARHGLCKGIVMAGSRFLKCGPWHPGGYDPVPF